MRTVLGDVTWFAGTAGVLPRAVTSTGGKSQPAGKSVSPDGDRPVGSLAGQRPGRRPANDGVVVGTHCCAKPVGLFGACGERSSFPKACRLSASCRPVARRSGFA